MYSLESVRRAFVLLLVAASARADGFLFNGQSARALGVMNACAAQADDPSTALVLNPGGLALLPRKTSAAFGATLGGTINGHFRGTAPGIANGTAAEERTASDAAPHAYLAMPAGRRLVAGIGAYSLFRMQSEWSDPQHYAGRFIATRSSVESTDLTAAAGYAVTPKVGVGVGAVYRTTRISASRVGAQLPDEKQSGVGFNAGVLYRPLAHWSFALSYRNDAAGMPAQTIGGVAWRPTAKFVFEIDAAHTAWSTLQQVTLGDAVFPLDLEDTNTLRAGFRHRLSPRAEWHLGYTAERPAQPDHTVGAFLHDAQRSTYGAGLAFGAVDVAFSWSTNELRQIDTSIDALNGNYRRNAWLIAVTVTK